MKKHLNILLIGLIFNMISVGVVGYLIAVAHYESFLLCIPGVLVVSYLVGSSLQSREF